MDSKTSKPQSTLRIECPFAIKWEIEESKLVHMKNSEGEFLTTELFDASNISGVKYFLEIYPNGDDEESRGKVSIFLNVQLENEKKINSNFKFIVESVGFVSEEKDYEDIEPSMYGETLCTTEELFDPEQKYIVDGKLSLKCQGTVSVQEEIKSADKQWEDNDVGKALWNRGDKDFTIVVDGNILHAHKCLLAVRSPAFDAMFNSGMIEAIENRMEITDLSYETVDVALQLCYNRKISSLTVKEKSEVIQFFDKYEILNLKDATEAFLIEDISTSNVCRIANSSLISNAIKLQQKCMDFLVYCSKNGVYVKDFDDLDNDYTKKVFENTFYNVISKS